MPCPRAFCGASRSVLAFCWLRVSGLVDAARHRNARPHGITHLPAKVDWTRELRSHLRRSRRRRPLPHPHARGRPCRLAPARRGDAARGAERRHLRAQPERRHGLGARPAAQPRVSDPGHAGRHPRARRLADRARIPHRPLGGRPADARRGRGARPQRPDAVRRLRDGSVRRSHAGDARDDGEPRLPQRRRDRAAATDPLAAAQTRRDGHRDLRQGAARDDGRAGGDARAAGDRGARRRDPPADRGRGRGRRADHRGALLARPADARAGRRPRLCRVRLARRRLPVPRHGRHQPGRRRGVRTRARALRARPLRPADLARARAPLGSCSRGDGRGPDRGPGHRHRRRAAQRDGRARRVRRLDEPAPAHPRDRARSRSAAADGRRLDAHQPLGPAPRQRAPQRTRQSRHRPRLPGRRGARGDAAPAAARPAPARRDDRAAAAPRRRPRRVGAQRAAQPHPRPSARARRRRSRRGDPLARAIARARRDQHRVLSDREPGARGLGRQEHGDRSLGARSRRRLPADRARTCLHKRASGDRRDQAGRAERRRRRGRDGTRPARQRHGGDLPADLGA